MKRKVYLDGQLGERYGTEFEIEANSFSDVVRCLDANFDDFRNYLIECHEKGIGFLCEIAGNSLEYGEELLLEFGEGDMYISAQPMGAKSSGQKFLAAIILVAYIYFTGDISKAAEGQSLFSSALAGTQGAFAQVAALMAVSLTLQGFQQLLLPDPSVDANPEDDSYLFQGAGQTILEGQPVPILYGELRIPGRPISFHLRSAQRSFYNDSLAQQDAPGDDNDPDEDDNPPTEQPPTNPREEGPSEQLPSPQPGTQPRFTGR